MPLYRLIIEVVLIAWLLLPFGRLLPAFSRWFDRNLIFAVLLALTFGMFSGLIGADYGLRDLFWHESLLGQFRAGIGLAFLVLYMVVTNFLVDGDRDALLRDVSRFLYSRPGLEPLIRAGRLSARYTLNVVVPPMLVSPYAWVRFSGWFERLGTRWRLAFWGAVDHSLLLVRRLGSWAQARWSRVFSPGPGTSAPGWSGWLLLVPSGLVLGFLLTGVAYRANLTRVCRMVNRRRLRDSPLYQLIVYYVLVLTPILIVVAVPACVFAVDEAFRFRDKAFRVRFDAVRFLTVPAAVAAVAFAGVLPLTICYVYLSRIRTGAFLEVLARHWFLRQAALCLFIVINILRLRFSSGADLTTPDLVFILMYLVVLAAALTKGSVVWRAVLTVMVIAWAAWTNGRDPYKLTYPGLEVDHAHQSVIRYGEAPTVKRALSLSPLTRNVEASSEGVSSSLLDDTELRRLRLKTPRVPSGSTTSILDDAVVLNRWREAQRQAIAERAKTNSHWRPNRPKLVVVAVSGGGITAAVWTALNLKMLEKYCKGFPSTVRLITGASGGMLGAATYTAALEGPADLFDKDREKELDNLVEALAADSLTPTLRRTLADDLGSIFTTGAFGGHVDNDRGRELERVWEEHTAKLGKNGSPLSRVFRSLAPGEEAGWRPSLVVAPMIVEDAAPMLISNLDLDDLNCVEFFKLFSPDDPSRPKKRDEQDPYDAPERVAARKTLRTSAQGLKVATAVRMNAAFPLVSPATNLPTEPPRRLVDAGYFDNYGVTIAHAWLTRNREWLAENTSDVLLIQIRAYPIASGTNGVDSLRAIRESWDWLTTPVEGYTAANKRAMLARNQDKVDALAQWFDDRRASAKAASANFHSFVLECPESAPLSWYLARKDLHLLRFRCHDWENIPRDIRARLMKQDFPSTYPEEPRERARVSAPFRGKWDMMGYYQDQFNRITRVLGPEGGSTL